MNNLILNLLSYLLLQKQREPLKEVVEKLKIKPPYKQLFKLILAVDGDFTKTGFIQLISDKISSELKSAILESMPESSDKALAYTAINELQAMDKIDYIVSEIRSNKSPTVKLNRIIKSTESLTKITKPKSKLVSQFTGEDSHYVFTLLGYEISKQDLVLLCGFTGIGKTRILLAITRKLLMINLKCLFISIADWSEAKLKAAITGTPTEFPDFYAACFSECSISNIEMELDLIQPKVLIVDYLTEISDRSHQQELRHQLSWNTRQLKRIAQEYNIPVITAHQLNKMANEVVVDDLAEAKSGILKHVDVGLGIGGQPDSYFRNITTLKLRNQKALPMRTITVDLGGFTYS